MQLTRYMSFPRFVSCLIDGLFIPSPILFDDRWEGLMPFGKLPIPELALRSQDYDQFAPWMYVSCWHQQLRESIPMWKIYGQTHEAISVRTTYDKLEAAFAAQYPNVLAYFNLVDYVDPATANVLALRPIYRLSSPPAEADVKEPNSSLLYMYMKHAMYEYEREVRLVTLDPDFRKTQKNPRKGIHLNIRATVDFIEHVTIAPGADDWFYHTVKETAVRFGLHCQVSRSQLEFPHAAREMEKP